MAEMTEDCPECPTGIPAWMATFADLMSLLMCFFVLLLSFSEMDVLKYKQLSGSMRDAFGVQRQINVKDVPKGTSVIAQEFSPGRPEPTPISEVRQATVDDTQSSLDIGERTPQEPKPDQKLDQKSDIKVTVDEELAKQLLVEKLQTLIKATEDDARNLASALKKEISSGKVDVETRGRRIIIRVREQGSFPSGSAELRRQFRPVMAMVRNVLKTVPGKVSVEGHTDSIPISTSVFRSNWDLSSARALSVAHELFSGDTLDHNRFMVTGFADTKPIAANDNEENRARNRRVEIVIHQGLDDETSEELKKMQQIDPGLIREFNLDSTFILTPDEVF